MTKKKDRKRKYKKAVKNLPDNNDQMIALDEFVEVTFDKTFNQGCGAGAGAACLYRTSWSSEALLIGLYTTLISEDKLKRRQHKSSVANEYALHAKWKEYEKRDCTTERLLTFASRKCPTSFPE